MGNDTATHVEPIRLWQCLCGGSDLPKHDYQHVINCEECETLATEIGDALDDLEGTLRRRGTNIS
jgi:hypothetical protein